MHIQNRPRKPLLSSCNRRGPVSIEALEQRIAPAAFVVSTTADGGIGSLRQALLDAAANGSTSADTITFNINDTSGPVKLIRPGTPLPDVSVGVLIDGYTQNGSSRNTLDVGNNAILNVVLDGSLLGPANGLRLLGDDTVTGLVIHGFNSTSAITGNGILVEGDNGNNVIVGNWIGVDQTGTIARGNAQAGIALRDAGPGNQIGSSAAADRNVISGNSVGIELFAVTATGTKNTLITNNFIGTDKSGTADLGNIADGVRILGNNNFVVGNVLRGNVISGNDGNGIQIRNPAPAVSGNRIFANLIGATQAGTALGNSSSGILINNSGDNLIGMAGANGELNVVAYNGGNGITMTGAQGTPNPIRGNSIFGNGGLGIDLGSDGITLNDSGDGDAGPNQAQNFPVLTSATRGAGGSTISGSLASQPGMTYSIDLFASASGDPSGYGEGATYLGFKTATADAFGNLTFSFSTALMLPAGSTISATATDALGNTSEFSQFAFLTTDFVWTGAQDSDWFKPANWSPNGVPGPGDSATLNNSGTLMLASPATVAAFTQINGTLTGPATLTIHQNFHWSGGTEAGTGGTTVLAGATFLIDTAAVHTLNGRTVTNMGNATWSGGQIALGGGAFFNNQGTFDDQIDERVTWSGLGTGTFDNTGTFTKSVGSGSALFDSSNVFFDNSGTVSVHSGTLSLTSANPVQTTGTFILQPGTQLVFGGNRLFTASSSIVGQGDVSFIAGTHNFNGTYNLAGASTFGPAGAVTFEPGATISKLAGVGKPLTGTGGTTTFKATLPSLAANPLVIAGGLMDFVNNPVSVPSFTFSGGTFASNADLDINTLFTWQENTAMTGNGTTHANAGTLISGNSGGSEFLTDGRRFHNPAGQTVTWNGNNVISIGNGAEFLNEGTFLVQNTGSIVTNGGGAFNNAGSFIRDNGSSSTAVGVLNNSGTIELKSGTLSVQQFTQTAGTTQLDGGVLATSGAALAFQGGTLTGTGSVTGPLSNQGAVVRPGGTGVAGVITVNGTYTQGAGGTLAVELGGTAPGQFDQLVVNGQATLAGVLNIARLNGFVPVSGNAFEVVPYATHSGMFESLNGQTGGFTQNAGASGLSLVQSSINYVWDAGGGTDTSWFTAANWSPDGVPGTGDSATLNSNATITLPLDTQVSFFNQNNGTFTGAGTLSVSGGFAWDGGTQAGTGTTRTLSGSTLLILGSGHQLQRRIDNAGDAIWDTVTTLNSGQGAILDNSGSFLIRGNADFAYNLGGSTTIFNNSGTVTRSTGTGTASLSGVVFNNFGLVNAESGILTLAGGGFSNGIFNIASAGELKFGGGSHALSYLSQISGAGRASFTSGMVEMGGSYNAATTVVTNGVVNFTGVDATTTTLNQSGGTLGGSALFRVSGAFNWSGGIQHGTGFTDLPAGSTLKITGAGHQLQRRIDNAGAATWNTGIRVDSRDGALFNNIGTLDIEDDGSFSFDAVGVRTVFTNTGTVTKSGGTATFFFSDVAFNNRGTVNIESGALNFNGGGISTGLFQVDGGTSLIFGGGSHSLSPTSRVTGDGTVRFTNGEVDIDGSYDAHTTVITNGTAYFDVTGSTRLLQQSGGELGGAGTFSVRTTFTWSGGSQSGTGITELPAGSTLEITGLGHKLQRRLDNAGAGTWNTTARIDSGNGAIFNNQGSLEILSDGSLSYNLGGVQTVFNNSGLLQKTGGTVATSFANVVLNNSGAIVAGSGTLNFNGPFTQTSGTTELNGGALFTVGTLNFAGGDLTGSGTITGNVSNTGATVFPGGIEASGVIEITGNYTQGAGGTLAIEIGGLVAGQDFDQLDVGGTADLNGTLDLALINSYSAPAGSSFETLRYGAQSGFFTALTGEPGFTQSYQAAALFVVRGALDYVWNGSVSDDWFTPENWTPNGIPGAADNASIDEAPHAVNVSGQNAAINDLNLRDNTLFGNARLDVGGTMTWTGGEIRLNTNIASLLNISGIESKLLRGNNGGGGGILNIAHGANVAWSGGTLFLQDFAVINNAGTFDAQSENINPSGNNFSTFNNLAGGLFTKTNSGTTGIAPLIRFVNHGTLHANAGALVEINDLTLNEGSLFTGAGVTQAINGLLLISGNTQIAADATFELAGSQANGAGTFGGAGTFLWTSGRLQGELSIESGGMLVMDGFGNKVIRGDSTGTHGILTISPGATALLKGSGDLRMQDQGIINNAGTFEIASNEPISTSGSPSFFNNLAGAVVTKTVTGTTSITGGITFTNEGTITTTTSATLDFGALLLADGSSITGPGIVRLLNGNLGFEPNAITSLGAGATLNLTGTAILSGTGTFGGAGRFDWSGGTIAGNLTIDTDSTMLIRGGAVKLLRGNNAGTAGILNIADGAAVEWSDSGNLEFQDQATINNGGLFTAKNSQNLAYVSGNQGRFNNLAGGTFTKESGGTTFVTGGLRFANSGTVHASTPDAILDFQLLEAANGGTFTGAGIHRVTGLIEIAGTTNLATGTVMELAGGTLQGTGAFAGNGHLSWISGTILGSPTIASGSTMLIGGNGSKLLQGNNSGTNGILNIESGASVIWTGSGNIAMQDFAIIRNNGVFDSRDDHSFNYAGGSAPLFSNLSGGKLLKSGGSGGTAFGGSIAVENAGTVQAVSGTLAFNSGYTQTGGLTRLNGGAIATGGTIALQGGTLTGVGIIVGNVTNAATIEPGNNGTGILSITGNYSQTNTGRLSVEIGGTAAGTGFDQLAVGSTTTLGGTLNIAYAAGFTPDEDQQFQVVASTNNPGLFASITGETALSQSAGAAGLTLLTSVTSPDLLLTSDNGVTATTPGSQLSYTLNYRNDSPQAADGVQLTQTLPAGSTFNAAASTSGWVETTAGSGVFRLFIGTLAGGAAGTATFAVVVDSIAAAGREQLTSTASIADDGDNGADPTPANNSAIDSDILTAAPDLVLVKTDQHTATTPGSILSYTLDYRNDGNQDATGVILTETLPAGTRFNAAASSQGWIETAPGSGIFTLNKGTLGGGMAGSAIFAVTVDTPALAGRDLILAGASIADDGTNGSDTAPANNLATDSNILDAAPDLQLSKSNNVTVTTPGSPLSYTLNYRNDGDQGATGVRLTETLPLGTTFNAAASTPGWVETAPGVFTLEVGALAGGGANGSATFAINVNATVASGLDTLSSSATISDDGTNGAEPTPANNTATDIDTLDAAPELAVTSSDALTTTTPGSLVTYTIAYRNDGNQDAKGVVLTKLLPAGTTFNPAASTPGWSESVPGVFTLNVDALAAGGTGGGAIFAVTVNAPAPAGLDVISSTAIIGDDGQNGADPVPANNAVIESTTLNAAPDLKISVSDAAGVAKRGGTTRYTLTYNNQGNQDASGVFLFETLPANSTFNSAQSSPGWVETAPNSGVYRFEIGNLAAGAAGGTATFAIKLAQTLPAGFLGLAPTASIDDDRANGVDPDGFNNTAAIITPIYQGVYIVAPGVGVPRGATPVVRVFDIASGNQSFAFSAYESTYRGGVRLAVGDFNGDGVDDIITSTRLGTGRIRIFDGVDGEQLAGPFGELNAFSGRAARGAFVASGDVNGDGRDDLIVGSGRGGGTVQVYDGLTAQLLNTYTPFGSKFKGGVRVAVGDVDGNGTEDIVLSQGDSGSRVQVYSGATTTVLHDFKAAPKSHRTGIFVAAADIDGDGKADIIAGRDIRSAAIVESFSGVDHHSISRIVAFGQAYRNGVRVAATDVNFDGIADIIATSGTKGGSQVKIFDGRSGSELPGFSAFPDFPDVSLFAAATTRVPSVAAVGILP